MAKKKRFPIARSFAKNVLRAEIKAGATAFEALLNPTKWAKVVQELLDGMIFEVMDDKAAFEQSEKLSERLDTILTQQLKAADQQETDSLRVLLELQSQSDFNEEVKEILSDIVNLVKNPETTELSEGFANSVNNILAKDEELLELALEGFVKLSEEHEDLSKQVDESTEQIRADIEEVGVQLAAIRASETGSKKQKQFRATRIFLSKMPITGRELFGRSKGLLALSQAWVSQKKKIISFVAWGGVGKTALVNEWLNRMGETGWRGAERVYGWSFYSQGTKEDRQAASDTFLVHALEWFGDKETAESPKSPWNKGVRLAELIRGQKTLLILDGVEPLQYPPGPMHGRLKDQGLQGLLRELSHGMDGLCVITTRERIEDLDGQVDHTVRRVELENLSPEAGMQVLRAAGVTEGTDKELVDASEEFGGHALALTLLGNYLAVVHGGEIRKRDLVPALTEAQEKGGHAKRVMQSYEIRLKLKPELDILYLMGLFDRPAEAGAIKALREEPAIKGLTENLAGLSEAEWKYAVNNLRGLGLLAKEDKDRPDDLDCHPLVREHFGEELKNNKPEAWREAHGRLYEYYKELPEKEFPDTLEEMEPLFRAVYHGCAAGEPTRIWEQVYWDRINRGNDYFIWAQLGAFGSWLGAVGCFFDKIWSKPAAKLTDARKALVLSQAGFCLRAVGRLREAAEPFKTSLGSRVKDEKWKFTAIDAGNLSELYLTLGEVEKAVEYGSRCVEYADKSRDEFSRMGLRTTVADALHRVGDVEEAKRLFEEAEGMQKERQPEYPHLYWLQGYRYCVLLLAQGKTEEVKERVKQTLEWVTEQGWLLDMALDKVSLGRAELYSASRDIDKAEKWLNEAVDGLRNAGTRDHLPRGLLARAELYRKTREFEKAEADLEEAREIAERGEMKLFLADYHLEAGRLCAAQQNMEGLKGHYEKAAELVKECGYHRRDKEVEELRRIVESG